MLPYFGLLFLHLLNCILDLSDLCLELLKKVFSLEFIVYLLLPLVILQKLSFIDVHCLWFWQLEPSFFNRISQQLDVRLLVGAIYYIGVAFTPVSDALEQVVIIQSFLGIVVIVLRERSKALGFVLRVSNLVDDLFGRFLKVDLKVGQNITPFDKIIDYFQRSSSLFEVV